jgi:hypothetical protein
MGKCKKKIKNNLNITEIMNNKYLALAQQAGTDAPTEAHLYENTVGTISFARAELGNYTITGSIGATIQIDVEIYP